MEDSFVPTETAFTNLIARADNLSLIRDWRDVIFHALFVKKRQGLELPMLLPFDGNQCFVASPDPDAVRATMADYSYEEDLDVFIKPVALGELARNAYLLGAWLCWVGPKLVMNSSLMHLLGMKALAYEGFGQERLYQAIVHEIQGSDGDVVPIKAQTWRVSRVSENGVTEVISEHVIFDDRDFVILGSDVERVRNARKRSQLSADEQAMFDWWGQPVYDFAALQKPDTEGAGDVGEESYVPVPSIPDESYLTSFYDLERAVNNQIMPDSTRLRLEVVEDEVFPEVDDRSEDEFERVKGRRFGIRFADHPEWSLSLGGGGLAMSDYSDEVWLPRDAGVHEMPEHLRLKLIRAIAWVLFWKGQEIGKRAHLVPGQFEGVKPFCPDNLNRLFVPDKADHRFPVLAAMPCGTEQVPVLVHGEVPEGYVCEVLERCTIPASDLPRGLAGRDALLVNGAVPFGAMCSFIVVPVAAIEFPEDWYTGFRTSTTQLIADLEFYLGQGHREAQVKSAGHEQKDPDGVGNVLGICLVFFVFVILLIAIAG